MAHTFNRPIHTKCIRKSTPVNILNVSRTLFEGESNVKHCCCIQEYKYFDISTSCFISVSQVSIGIFKKLRLLTGFGGSRPLECLSIMCVPRKTLYYTKMRRSSHQTSKLVRAFDLLRCARTKHEGRMNGSEVNLRGTEALYFTHVPRVSPWTDSHQHSHTMKGP